MHYVKRIRMHKYLIWKKFDMNNEWSLIVFTLLSQICIGLILLFSFFQISNNFNPDLTTVSKLKFPELPVLIAIGIAMLVSLLHLGAPKNAINSLNNIGFSWISKEILAIGIFGFSVAVLFVLRHITKSPEWAIKILTYISSLSGIYLLFAMIKLYMAPTILSWSNWYTPLSFINTTLVLGISTYFLIMFYTKTDFHFTLKGISLILVILLLIELGSSFIHYHYLKNLVVHNASNSFLKEGRYFLFLMIRASLILLSLVILITLISSNHSTENIFSSQYHLVISITLFLIFAEEVIGRYLFYGSFLCTGL